VRYEGGHRTKKIAKFEKKKKGRDQVLKWQKNHREGEKIWLKEGGCQGGR